jgi:hypothetical protein
MTWEIKRTKQLRFTNPFYLLQIERLHGSYSTCMVSSYKRQQTVIDYLPVCDSLWDAFWQARNYIKGYTRAIQKGEPLG